VKRTPFNRRPHTGRQSLARDAASARAYTFLRVAVHQREGGLCVACGVHESLEEGNCHHRQLAHDPHPDASGLVSVESVYMVRCIGDD
jgi:hypothetical protein